MPSLAGLVAASKSMNEANSAHDAFQASMREFVGEVCRANNYPLREVIRFQMHTQLDEYLDKLASAHDVLKR